MVSSGRVRGIRGVRDTVSGHVVNVQLADQARDQAHLISHTRVLAVSPLRHVGLGVAKITSDFVEDGLLAFTSYSTPQVEGRAELQPGSGGSGWSGGSMDVADPTLHSTSPPRPSSQPSMSTSPRPGAPNHTRRNYPTIPHSGPMRFRSAFDDHSRWS